MRDRSRILKALETMPDEAFGWLVLAMRPHAMTGETPALAQVWPDGDGGFTHDSRNAIQETREAVAEYLGRG